MVYSNGTARAKWEEGVGDGRSVWSETSGLHAAYNGRYNGPLRREAMLIPENRSKFGLRVATHPHETGMASNRESLSRGECVPAPCTHRPSSHPNVFSVRPRFLSSSNRGDVRGAKS